MKKIGLLVPKEIRLTSLIVDMSSVTDERDKIDTILVRVTQQCHANGDLLSKVEHESHSSSLISFSIIAVVLLFFSGVIYPLSFLPLKANNEIVLSLSAFWDILFSLKGILLSLISIIFISLLGLFFGVNLKLKFEKEKLNNLKKYCCLSAYSKYFGCYEDNKSEFKK